MAVTVTREPIKVLADILQTELGLSAGRVMIADEKFNIEQQEGLYISLEYVGPSQVIANTNHYNPATDQEEQTQTTRFLVQIDALSFDNSARQRKEEISMALTSMYSQRLQEQYQCSIARMPGPVSDASSIESMAMLKRYTQTVAITALTSKVKSAEYYDKFKTVEDHFNE